MRQWIRSQFVGNSRGTRRARKPARYADHDLLTGLPNRRALDALLVGSHAWVHSGSPTSLTLFDLDAFAAFNRERGFTAGDQQIRRTACVIVNEADPADVVFRVGGDKFVVLQPNTGEARAVRRAEHWREQIARAGSDADALPGERVNACGLCKTRSVTASAGVVTCTLSRPSPRSLRHAQRAVCVAKQQGGDRVRTREMAIYAAKVDRLATRDYKTPEWRLAQVLRACAHLVGPVQDDHLTTHAAYVSNLAVRIGRVLGADVSELRRLRFAGLCHDIGKFLVPEGILAKRGPLGDEERNLLSRHAGDGADMAMMLGADRTTAEYIRHHHTRFDGGLNSGDDDHEIPMGARILAVADALVAMTSHRPYSSPRTFPHALTELRRGAGTQFDPRVVDAVPDALLCDLPDMPAAPHADTRRA